MAQPSVRCQETGDLHFVTFSCYRRQAHFEFVEARRVFERSLEVMRNRYEFYVFGYVVMPEDWAGSSFRHYAAVSEVWWRLNPGGLLCAESVLMRKPISQQ